MNSVFPSENCSFLLDSFRRRSEKNMSQNNTSNLLILSVFPIKLQRLNYLNLGCHNLRRKQKQNLIRTGYGSSKAAFSSSIWND
ncbi:hypothetical protein BpHYR1_051619 [Brachionus plicatilis]|uniref:Uncharacterized protein n=1 Tax=Brachionus plicatilis TaxID=10195 RepID=A0A3M7R007_BRAPC|nr:hypothetical protein BpHYR1_051619 [Brachionus plicatilis]